MKLEYCKEAIFYTNKSLAITQDNFSAWSLLVYCYLQLKDYPQALASYETGIKYYTEKTVCNHLEFILKSNSNFRVVHINSDHNGWVDNEDEVIKICNIILDSTT